MKTPTSLMSIGAAVGTIATTTACTVDGRGPTEMTVNCTAARADSTLMATDTVGGRVLRVWLIENTPQTCDVS